jgi:hypothetical protein
VSCEWGSSPAHDVDSDSDIRLTIARLVNQQACLTARAVTQPIVQTSATTVMDSRMYPSTHNMTSVVRSRQVRVPSLFERIGVYQRELFEYISANDNQNMNGATTSDVIVSRKREIFVARGFMKFVLCWNRQQVFGCIPMSVQIYPVVDQFGQELETRMWNAPLHEIQQMISSGSLHPFTRDSRGQSLLHVRIPIRKLQNVVNK